MNKKLLNDKNKIQIKIILVKIFRFLMLANKIF